jgi:hypothetical membrane protein
MRTTIGALILLSGIVLMLIGVFAPRAHYEVPGAGTTPWRVLLVLAFPMSWVLACLVWVEVL